VTVALALAVGLLYGVGTWLLLQRTLSRIVLGLAMLTHGANLLLLLAGGRAGRPRWPLSPAAAPTPTRCPRRSRSPRW
jgi:multisubunit Na+/H+ antiporter MnhC subunit